MLIPDGFAQANIRFTGANLPSGAEVTLGLDKRTFLGSPVAAATAVLNAFQKPIMRARIVTQTTISSCLVKFGPQATGASGEFSNPLTGTAANEPASPNVTWLIRKNTAAGGRTGRGRMYLPGISEPALSGAGVIIPAEITAMNDAMAALLLELQNAELDPVVLHAPLSPVTTPIAITSLTVDSTVATQRRRLRR